MRAQEMLNTYPNGAALDERALVACIEACFECAQTCTACADACLAEDQVSNLRRCIRLNLDCADVCTTTGQVLSRQTAPDLDLVRAQVGACLRACQVCEEDCRHHADEHEHCRVCAEACQRCAEACDTLLNTFTKTARAQA